MFFNESEYLLRDGVAGRKELESIDRYLASIDTTQALIDPVTVARISSVSQRTVERVLSKLAERRVLGETEYVRCDDPACATLNDVMRIRASGSRPYLCGGGCGGEIDPELSEGFLAYQLLELASNAPEHG